MAYQSLIVPSESVSSVAEIKRALITYDRVILVEPGDRDVIPPNALMMAMGMPPILATNTGPVRPMGKVPNYDNDFDRLMELLRDACADGLIEVQSSFDRTKMDKMTIGYVDTGGYPLNTNFLFWLYRTMASDQGFLRDAIGNDIHLLLRLKSSFDSLAIDGKGDWSINNTPALPLLQLDGLSEDVRLPITRIARSRIASFIKFIGYCEAKELIPILNSGCYGALAGRLIRNAIRVLGEEEDAAWLRRNSVLRLCHEEFMLDARLEDVSVKEVVKLRTRAWGAQSKAREKLFDSALQIAQDAAVEQDFEAAVRPLISDYRALSEDLVRERRGFDFSIKCDLAKVALASASALGGSEVASKLLTQLGTPVSSVALLLAAGGIWVFDKAKEYQPTLSQMKAKEMELRRSAGLGIHGFYSRIPNC
jgi:hypothetical protein